MSFVFVLGGVVGNPVELFDLRHFSCAMVFQMGLYMYCDVIEFVFPSWFCCLCGWFWLCCYESASVGD